MIPSPTFSSSSVAGDGQPPIDRDLPGSSKNTKVDTHKTIGLDNPEVHGVAAKPLDLYSVSHYADLQQKINSKKDLCDLVIENISNCSELVGKSTHLHQCFGHPSRA